MKENSKHLIKDFTSGNIPKQLVIFATPLFLSSLLQIAYNMVDMIIVGMEMGKVGLSAVSIGGDVTTFLTFLAMGFSNAGQVIISQYIGANQRNELGRFIGNMVSFLLISALIISGICLTIRTPILEWMNTPNESFSEALNYSTTCMVGLIFIYGYNVISAILRGLGDSKHPFLFISIAAILNVILDIIFVMLLNMGAGGAALATVISQAVSFILCMIFLWKRKENLGFSLYFEDFTTISKDKIDRLTKLGIPMAIKSASIQFSKMFVNSWINSYGVAVSAMAGIANKFNSTSNLISNSVNTSGSSMVGQNIAAKEYKRVSSIMKVAGMITLSIATLMSILLLIFPEPIFGIFTKEAEVMELAMGYIPIAILMFYGSALRAPMNTLINGSGNYKINYATAILDGIVLRIGFAALFGLGLNMEYTGFWLGDALAGFTPFWIGLIYYYSNKWKK